MERITHFAAQCVAPFIHDHGWAQLNGNNITAHGRLIHRFREDECAEHFTDLSVWDMDERSLWIVVSDNKFMVVGTIGTDDEDHFDDVYAATVVSPGRALWATETEEGNTLITIGNPFKEDTWNTIECEGIFSFVKAARSSGILNDRFYAYAKKENGDVVRISSEGIVTIAEGPDAHISACRASASVMGYGVPVMPNDGSVRGFVIELDGEPVRFCDNYGTKEAYYSVAGKQVVKLTLGDTIKREVIHSARDGICNVKALRPSGVLVEEVLDHLESKWTLYL